MKFDWSLRFVDATAMTLASFREFEEPIRAEIFSVERIEQYAESLATEQHVTKQPSKGRRLAPRVEKNGRILLAAYREIADAIRLQRAITPAAEWLIDNFYIVDEQLRDIRDHLPPEYYKELPKLAAGDLAGFPRIYGMMWGLVAHTDSRFDPELLLRYVRAYQRVQPLTMGELWAVAITLRVVLVENLRRLGVRIVGSQMARKEADELADAVLGLEGVGAGQLKNLDSELMLPAFAVQLVQRLRYQDPQVTPALKWLDERLHAQGTNAEDIVLMEHNAQASANVSVRNIITSMRLISAFDWESFVEQVSLVNEILGTSPGYNAMDFTTRDRYRHGIENLAKGSGLAEKEVALRVLNKVNQLAAQTAKQGSAVTPAQLDPGYYLISRGRIEFEREIGFKLSLRQRLMRNYISRATLAYVGTIGIISAAILWATAEVAWRQGIGDSALALLIFFGAFPALEIGVALVNRAVPKLIEPRHLPRLKLQDGVPDSARTFVVVPTLLGDEDDIREQVSSLEIHYLSNPDGEVYFALVSDWHDADSAILPHETERLVFARAAIADLNRVHGLTPGGIPRFYLLHRQRQWNLSEQKWIGWERKRGKLHEFNRLLRGKGATSFLFEDSMQMFVPKNVRYVITLDADTKLPKGAVNQMVGAMAHPLNRPYFDPDLQRVTRGYGIMQPRVTPSLPTRRESTIFQRLFSGPCGIDPYAAAVSDVYQDLFGEGSYTGKGIYDVDIFESALVGRVPENSLLSHDLFEGIFARTGFLSDVEVFEEFPSHLAVSLSRAHRWARGDWQLLPWVFKFNKLGIPTIGRWKMVDNLRRSVTAPATVALLTTSWLVPGSAPWAWLVLVLAGLAVPAMLPFITGLIPSRTGIAKRSYLDGLMRDFILGWSTVGTSLMLLAQQAWSMSDAILRTLWRLLVTKRHLLEWTTAAQAKSRAGLELSDFFRIMRGSLFLTFGLMLALALVNPHGLEFAFPLLLLWSFAPVLARKISLPPPLMQIEPLSDPAISMLRSTARQTWRFFSTFVSAADNHLPPDNFQEFPSPVIAHRSSPTNFGLYLLSVIAARDFGWVGMSDMTQRLEQTLNSLDKLERFRGHFYNWYETTDLRALEPKYISSVDSGNLAGHLIALAQACMDISERPMFHSDHLNGIRDGLYLLRLSASDLKDDKRSEIVNLAGLNDALTKLEELAQSQPQDITTWIGNYDAMLASADTLADISITIAAQRDESGSELVAWAEAVRFDIGSHTKDIAKFMSWAPIIAIAVPVAPPENSQSGLQQLESRLRALLESPPALAGLAALCQSGLEIVGAWEALPGEGNRDWLRKLRIEFLRSSVAANGLLQRLKNIASRARAQSDAMDFNFLYEPARKLFSIGYNVAEAALDASYYDLLASEARLTSFIAIAKGDVPAAHWFRLGRALTPVNKGAALISWSGSMFEYLMPALVMRSPAGSLLERTANLVVWRQIQYGHERGFPWGISESAYNVRDLALTYQYSNFGVPGLGLKRGLADDSVIAPYATMLAAMYQPAAAAKNLARIESLGGRGSFGFYEALDFTRERLPQEQNMVVVKAYMAHHQGMSLVSIDNVLNENIMRRRFHREPRIQSAQLLLQERTPRDIPVTRPRAYDVKANLHVKDYVAPILRRFYSPNLSIPTAHLLSNGRYAVMITGAGSGYSVWGELAVTRWREDVTRDNWGSYIYLRDVTNGEVWSATYQPTCVESDHYEIMFAEDRARIIQRDGSFTSALEIIVSPEDDVEIRRLTLTNGGSRAREIEVTSYAEITMTPQQADAAHPAFSNLFIQTEYIESISAIVASRRPRSAHDAVNWFAHVVSTSEGETAANVEYETDRARFLGRGHTVANPLSVINGWPLSNTVGAVLDPVASLRKRIRIAAGASVHVTFSTMAAATREEIIGLADKYHDPAAFERASTLAWTHAQVQLHYLGIGNDEANLFQRLANRILYSDPSLRPSSAILQHSHLPVSGLWAHRISGDLPIVLVRIDDADDRGLLRQLLRAHEYWRMRHLAVDLVILNEKPTSYAQDLQVYLENLVRACQGASAQQDAHGDIFLVRADLLQVQDKLLLQTAARAILTNRQGSLNEQVMRAKRTEPKLTRSARKDAILRPESAAKLVSPKLEFFNGLGGFANNGREYVIVLGPNQRTPAPWSNIIANRDFGFIVSESGSSYTWSVNSRENQLTPWSNDPVSDPSGEAIYISDLDTGEFWTPTALPVRIENALYITTHGQGYSRFEHLSHDVYSDLVQFVAVNDAVKISALRLENKSARSLNLSVTGYVEWVLGFLRSTNAPFIITEIDAETGALFAYNPWSTEFGKRIAFFGVAPGQISWTGDRTEFLGRNGSPDSPAVLLRDDPLSGKTGAGFDPCAALQCKIELVAGEALEVRFMLGQAASREEARELILRYRAQSTAILFEQTKTKWDAILEKVEVITPERSLDLMLNRWLLYQTLTCRFWARTAFYQAGGAYGFRDQLQDSMALVVALPDEARAQILRAAARQFPEGDVQHWWHPPTGRGVRTRISDDLIWLPYVVLNYVEVTDDKTILDQLCPFLEGPILPPGQEDSYFAPSVSNQQASVFEHCARTLDRSLLTGSHGLPLIGSGDWNDGMNRVGQEGRGESVWLAWFLNATLRAFAPVAAGRGEVERAQRWLRHAEALRVSIEDQAWDGAWYRRAYFDDGTPLGSAANTECRIDSIAQSWAIISGAGMRERAEHAMRAVDQYLIRQGDDLVLLFTPPFDKTPLDPGYIKGYLPGVRENGGQYTHAAVWCVIAYAMLGDGDKANELFTMMNPVNHASTRAGVHRYKVEPYVAAADIYAIPPHTGRGGWTWYTGSAGWMLRAGVEWMLGLHVRGAALLIDPCIPRHWPEFQINYRYGSARYEIRIENPHQVSTGVVSISLDGVLLERQDKHIPLVDDGLTHKALVTLGEPG
ncbi:MAG: GH36-type glycosyl hydrolase domain-containing protein [Sulfuriferula sp.]